MSRRERRRIQSLQDKRKARENARRRDFSKPLYVSTLVLCLTGYYFRHDLKWFPLVLIVFILAILVATKRYNKALHINNYKWGCLLVSAAFLLLCIDITHRPDSLFSIWKPWLAVTFLFASLMVWMVSDVQAGKGTKVFYIALGTILSAFPAIGIVYFFNYVLDTSTPEIQHYTITHKSVSKGKNRNNRVMFTPAWQENGTPVKAQVSTKYYESVALNDIQEIPMHKGAFGIRWYMLDGEH